jgi:hypothetical protein
VPTATSKARPTNDRLEYFRLDDLTALLDEIETLELGTREIAFTGGEPFMNPDMPAMMRAALERGHEVLVLTNAMQPMQRPKAEGTPCWECCRSWRAHHITRQPGPSQQGSCTKPSVAKTPGTRR